MYNIASILHQCCYKITAVNSPPRKKRKRNLNQNKNDDNDENENDDNDEKKEENLSNVDNNKNKQNRNLNQESSKIPFNPPKDFTMPQFHVPLLQQAFHTPLPTINENKQVSCIFSNMTAILLQYCSNIVILSE